MNNFIHTLFYKYDDQFIIGAGLLMAIILAFINHHKSKGLFEKTIKRFIFEFILFIYAAVISIPFVAVTYELLEPILNPRDLPSTGIGRHCNGFIDFYRIEITSLTAFLVLSLISYGVASYLWKKNEGERKVFLKYLLFYNLAFGLVGYFFLNEMLPPC